MTTGRRQGLLWEGEGFGVTTAGLRVTGQPSLGSWGRAVAAMANSRSAFQWGLGDLLLYADTRKWDDTAVEEVMDATGMKRGTMLNWKSVAKAFPLSRRRTDLPWSHHQLVMTLEEGEGDRLLDTCTEHRWGWEELREQAANVRHERARTVQTFPEGTFGLLYATPPWRSLTLPRFVMNVDEIAALTPQVQAITAPEAVLYLTAAFGQIEDALSVLRAWGFTTRGTVVTISHVSHMVTDFARVRHEVVLMGTRGRLVPPTMAPDSVITEGMEVMLERTYPDIPRVALFTPTTREGWTAWNHRPVIVEEQDRAIRLREVAVEEEPALVAVNE